MIVHKTRYLFYCHNVPANQVERLPQPTMTTYTDQLKSLTSNYVFSHWAVFILGYKIKKLKKHN